MLPQVVGVVETGALLGDGGSRDGGGGLGLGGVERRPAFRMPDHCPVCGGDVVRDDGRGREVAATVEGR